MLKTVITNNIMNMLKIPIGLYVDICIIYRKLYYDCIPARRPRRLQISLFKSPSDRCARESKIRPSDCFSYVITLIIKDKRLKKK